MRPVSFPPAISKNHTIPPAFSTLPFPTSVRPDFHPLENVLPDLCLGHEMNGLRSPSLRRLMFASLLLIREWMRSSTVPAASTILWRDFVFPPCLQTRPR